MGFSEKTPLLATPPAPYIGCCQRTTARKTPAISTRKCSCQKLTNPCPTLGQLLASRILYKLLLGEKQYEIAQARFCTQSCSKVGQLLVDSIFWDLDLGSKFLRQDSEMTLPTGSVSELPFSLKKSWELVCLRTARSLLQTLPRRLSQNPSTDRSRSRFLQ